MQIQYRDHPPTVFVPLCLGSLGEATPGGVTGHLSGRRQPLFQLSLPRRAPHKGPSLPSSHYYFLRLFIPFPRYLWRPKLLMEPKLNDTGYYKNLSLSWLFHFPTFHTLLIACVAVLPFSWKQYSFRDSSWPLSVVIIGKRGSLYWKKRPMCLIHSSRCLRFNMFLICCVQGVMQFSEDRMTGNLHTHPHPCPLRVHRQLHSEGSSPGRGAWASNHTLSKQREKYCWERGCSKACKSQICQQFAWLRKYFPVRSFSQINREINHIATCSVNPICLLGDTEGAYIWLSQQ